MKKTKKATLSPKSVSYKCTKAEDENEPKTTNEIRNVLKSFHFQDEKTDGTFYRKRPTSIRFGLCWPYKATYGFCIVQMSRTSHQSARKDLHSIRTDGKGQKTCAKTTNDKTKNRRGNAMDLKEDNV